ncbi:MAG TPA: PepSY domain-containing protein [Xanthobacteraceae bacterium]|jgi:uncharacterized membrane protein YkoI|nr:PepSY domain-containing protein [Xanthobacteraceae bacterium]
MTFSRTLAATAVCGAIAVGAATIPSPARAFTGEALAAEAKITLTEARAIALKTFPGSITSEELEKEKGGSGLRYSFDIKNGARLHEVGVDAQTGRVLENSVEHGGD